MRAPTASRGQVLTARIWNQLAQAVNQGIASPRDLDAGLASGEGAEVLLLELSRTVQAVRVTSPDDESVFVDVDRITSLTVRNLQSGNTEVTHFV